MPKGGPLSDEHVDRLVELVSQQQPPLPAMPVASVVDFVIGDMRTVFNLRRPTP